MKGLPDAYPRTTPRRAQGTSSAARLCCPPCRFRVGGSQADGVHPGEIAPGNGRPRLPPFGGWGVKEGAGKAIRRRRLKAASPMPRVTRLRLRIAALLVVLLLLIPATLLLLARGRDLKAHSTLIAVGFPREAGGEVSNGGNKGRGKEGGGMLPAHQRPGSSC
jgi:hypothetical protein